DDAAILRPTGLPLVWAVDTLVENTHFLRDMPPDQIGWKSLAVNLSDLAAMNAQPLAALLSLTLPPDLPDSWSEAFFSGLARACNVYRVDLAGGDSVRGQEIQISLSVLGQSAAPVTRTGARAGDLLVVSGAFGGAAAGLHCFRQGLDEPGLLARHWHPLPRFEAAAALAEYCPRLAMLDTSDGLARSLQLICEANGLGCQVEGQRIPVEAGLDAVADPARVLDWVLNGGEDYELLAAVPPETRDLITAAAGLTIIGQLLAEPAMHIHYPDRVLDLALGQWGFQHF
ncbi:MAG TPA: thiamine-phosphate kinase, partial [Candidatus Obscuribacterales bacterium]